MKKYKTGLQNPWTSLLKQGKSQIEQGFLILKKLYPSLKEAEVIVLHKETRLTFEEERRDLLW